MHAAKPCMAHPNKPTMLPPSAKKLINGLCKILLFFFGFLLGVLTNANLQSLHYPLTPWLPAPTPPSPPPPSAPAPPPPSPSPPPPPSAPPESGERLGLSGFLAPSGLMHDMTDEELLWRASMAPRDRSTPYRRVPKVAFLFLARGDLPLRPLWERFFAGHQGLYSIYVHTDPAYTDTPPKESVFYGRRIPSQKTAWGKPILVKAERRLLANALLDFSNEWFALISDSCVPLFAFPTVYAYVANSTTSFVDCFDDEPGRSRYDPFFADHNLTLSQWRKGSQFFEMDRPLAIEVVSEETYFPVFDIFCTNHSRRTCMMDEHYIPTMVHMWGWERNANRTLTFVEWRGGAHPVRYGKGDVTEGLLKGMRGSDPANCSYNGGLTDVCFLFARKFGADALELLLDLAPKVLGFG